jgi:hypothetical protein
LANDRDVRPDRGNLAANGAFSKRRVLMGAASVEYFRDYKGLPPREWIERPARTFNNLMQVPTLFYVVALLLIALRKSIEHRFILHGFSS